MTFEELLNEVERDRPFYEESGGGVTFSGGEPFMQGRFLLACLRECRERGLHTAVDTCGLADRRLVLEAGKLADLFLFDLKVLDAARHHELTGASIEPILDNLRALDAEGVDIAIRLPLIPGITDGDLNIEALGKLVSSLQNTRGVHLLPFHRTASDKYARLGRSWGHDRLEPLSGKAVESIAAALSSYGLEVVANGWIHD
jgi:pyruvate formate lyase activating enzyme